MKLLRRKRENLARFASAIVRPLVLLPLQCRQRRLQPAADRQAAAAAACQPLPPPIASTTLRCPPPLGKYYMPSPFDPQEGEAER